MINRRLLSFASQALVNIRKNVFFQWISLLCNAAISGIFCLFLAAIVSGTLNASIPVLAAVLVVLAVLRFFAVEKASQYSTASSLIIKEKMRTSIFEKLTAIGPGYLQKFSTAEIVQLTSEGVEQLETYFASYVPQFFYALLAPLTLFIISLWIDWKAGLMLLICVPLIPASIIFIQKFAKKLLNKYWGQYTQLGDSFLENLQGLTTLKVYQADEKRHEMMNEESEQFRRITMRVLIMQLNSISVMDLIAYGGAAAGICVAAFNFLHGSISFFSASYIILLSAEFFIPMRLLGSYFHIAMNGAAAADKMFAILDTEVHTGDEILPQGNIDICAENVSYTYPQGKEALKDISFSLEPTGFYGFAGKSGSGKSTLAACICQRKTGYTGSLLLAGKQVSQIQTASLEQGVSYLDHDSYLFAGTVASNLKMAREDATDEMMWQALKHAGIARFIREAGGLDYPILEQGSNLSGGQRQRIALARILLKDTPVIILDEATSSIDAYSEEVIMNAVHELARTKCVLCISHRLANLADARTIYVLQEGRLVEWGTQSELLKRQGEYARLWNTQKDLEEYVKGGQEDEEDEQR